MSEKKELITIKELDIKEIKEKLIRIEQRLEDLNSYLHEKLEYLDRLITRATAHR